MLERILYFVTLFAVFVKRVLTEGVDNVIVFFKSILANCFMFFLDQQVAYRPVSPLHFLS
ncbi:hypothetical protein FM120_02085 [Sphingobacterium faecium PCAi_F2.5]|nr:hypothetical protein BN1088_1430621 [Sphingobacterium sp. PM2-P1-29]SJN20603.1 hypothetical protein FM120_02085 [Sphingobacterium faecium PCAi_F2.5]